MKDNDENSWNEIFKHATTYLPDGISINECLKDLKQTIQSIKRQ